MNCFVTACPGPNQATAYGAPNNPLPTNAPQSIGPGYLRVSGRQLDYQRGYALEDPRTGALVLYALPANTSVNLEQYAGRVVTLYGSVSYRGDLKANFMTATSVSLAP
jgi:hypothetical protein